jgi:uncharacterized protein (DUF1330 family)
MPSAGKQKIPKYASLRTSSVFAVADFRATIAHLKPEKDMRKLIGPGLGMVAGIMIGAGAIQGLHAQAKPPVYVVIPILKVTDADTFKQIGPKAESVMPASGGHYVVRSNKITPLDGTPPERLVVIAFDNMEQAQAWHNSAGQKEIDALRVKSTKSLSYIVEGVSK